MGIIQSFYILGSLSLSLSLSLYSLYIHNPGDIHNRSHIPNVAAGTLSHLVTNNISCTPARCQPNTSIELLPQCMDMLRAQCILLHA